MGWPIGHLFGSQASVIVSTGMSLPSLPQLPPEVLDRLATAEGVTLHLGKLGSSSPVSALCAPLRGCTYLLFRPNARDRAAMAETTAASVQAEGPGGAWSVLARGRLLAGRPVAAEGRRAELAHWVPPDSAGWVACPFYPENVDYQEETPNGRRRAAGPVPGVVRPAVARFVGTLAYEPFQVWFLVSGALVAAGILMMDAEDAGTPLVLVVALAAAQLTAVGARLLLAPLDVERWRANLVPDESLGVLAEAWMAPAELRALGAKIAVAALALWVLLLLLAGAAVASLVSLLSGTPVILLAMAVRRRSTGAREDRES